MQTRGSGDSDVGDTGGNHGFVMGQITPAAQPHRADQKRRLDHHQFREAHQNAGRARLRNQDPQGRAEVPQGALQDGRAREIRQARVIGVGWRGD